jgi:hypothetical protein
MGQQRSFAGRRKLGGVSNRRSFSEFRGSRVIEHDVVRRLHSDLKR